MDVALVPSTAPAEGSFQSRGGGRPCRSSHRPGGVVQWHAAPAEAMTSLGRERFGLQMGYFGVGGGVLSSLSVASEMPSRPRLSSSRQVPALSIEERHLVEGAQGESKQDTPRGHRRSLGRAAVCCVTCRSRTGQWLAASWRAPTLMSSSDARALSLM